MTTCVEICGRSVSERSFDAIFVHDAIDYMITEADLRQAAATAYEHCRPSGVAVLVPDNIAEISSPAPITAAMMGRTPRRALPSPSATRIRLTPAPAPTMPSCFGRDGSVKVVHDMHEFFPRALWLRVLTDVGFRALGRGGDFGEPPAA